MKIRVPKFDGEIFNPYGELGEKSVCNKCGRVEWIAIAHGSFCPGNWKDEKCEGTLFHPDEKSDIKEWEWTIKEQPLSTDTKKR